MVAEAASLVEVGTVMARVSVLLDAGSELPADSDRAAVVCTAPVDEAVDDALDVVSLRVGQLWFQTDSEVVLPLIVDEQSMICDLVRPDSVPAVQAYMTTDICGDDRFSPGVTDCTSLDRQTICDSLGKMLLSQVHFSDVGRNCAMDFSDRWMCSLVWITDSSLWMLVQTLPLPREELTGEVGFPGASPEGVARLHRNVHGRG